MPEQTLPDETLHWRKSRRSGVQGQCVEIAPMQAGVAVRDSKNPTGPALAYTAGEWRSFLAGVRSGRLDP